MNAEKLTKTARRRQRRRAVQKRRWLWVAATTAALCLAAGAAVRLGSAPHQGLARPAEAQGQPAVAQLEPPRLLTEDEVAAGLKARLEAMRQRRAAWLERKAQEPRRAMPTPQPPPVRPR